MNPAIELTVQELWGQSRYSTRLEDEILSIMEELARDEDVDAILGRPKDRFKGMVVVKVYANGEMDITCRQGCSLSEEDKSDIRRWLLSDHRPYSEEFYRVDLENSIFIFQIFNMGENEKILVGHVLSNTIETKVDLLEARQDHLMRYFRK